MDENDAILVLDHALVPWENVLIYEDLEKSATFFQHSGFFARAMLHGCTRLAVKLDFIAGPDAQGRRGRRLGRTTATCRPPSARRSPGATSSGARPTRWRGRPCRGRAPPCCPIRNTRRPTGVFATIAYPRVKEIVESIRGQRR